MADIAHTLADIAAATYDANPAAGLPSGFTTVDLPNLGTTGGLYANGHALALVAQGVLGGEHVLVVAIRGTDDAHDWIADIANIDDEYAALKPLAAALEAYAAAGGKVVLTGHSMGGAMDQIFMAQHPNDNHYRAVTFGSPGALPQQGIFSVEADARITNYAISDDPFVFLGEHRKEVADYAVKNLAAGLGLAAELATVTHLTADTLLPTVRSLGADYVNNGATVTIAGAGAPLTIDGLAHANLSEHDPGAYLALTASSTLLEPSLWAPVDPQEVARWVTSVLRSSAAPAIAVENQLVTGLSDGGLTEAAALQSLLQTAEATTSVATLAYEFFTGSAPSAGGMDYLVSPTGPNPNNLNSAYFQSFSLENRYINFAVNLGKAGEGAAAFNAKYGGLSLFEATRTAYAAIFGEAPSDAKLHAILDPTTVLGGQTLSRADYFAYYGQDGANGIGAKAAMVGYLLAEAEKADLGVYAKSNDAFLTDVALHDAPFGVDLVGVYNQPGFVFHPG
jgi:pimeloyl-ACP methyl ester carboxylesterase